MFIIEFNCDSLSSRYYYKPSWQNFYIIPCKNFAENCCYSIINHISVNNLCSWSEWITNTHNPPGLCLPPCPLYKWLSKKSVIWICHLNLSSHFCASLQKICRMYSSKLCYNEFGDIKMKSRYTWHGAPRSKTNVRQLRHNRDKYHYNFRYNILIQSLFVFVNIEGNW